MDGETPPAQVAVIAASCTSPIATCASGVFHPPTGADTKLTLGQLALCGGVFLVVVVVVDVRVCGSGGCSYGVGVMAKCIGVSPRNICYQQRTQTIRKEGGIYLYTHS